MNQSVPQTDYPIPGNAIMIITKYVGQSVSSFTQNTWLPINC